MRESQIESYLINQVELNGGLHRKLSWIGRNSAPDQFVLIGGAVYLIEVKRIGAEATDAQKREHKRLSSGGVNVRVIDSPTSVDTLIKQATQMLSEGEVIQTLENGNSVFQKSVLRVLGKLQDEIERLKDIINPPEMVSPPRSEWRTICRKD